MRRVAYIGSGCLSWQGVMCGLCQEACEPGAIQVHQALGGYVLPEVDPERCNGCGACAAVCLDGVIELREVDEKPRRCAAIR